uniref:tyrosine--tRNA ligase n=2 Tax=Populus TaxID=3689 RepID=A0A4U5R5W6_POPAL|nr:hypothetical protein D5086_0000020060 [Populus alba]
MEENDQTPPSEEMQSLTVTPPASSSSNPTTPQLLSLEERFQLVRSVGEECIQEDELRNLLEKKPLPICYDGFEPSGRMHIAQGVMKTINVNKLTKAGCKMKIWIADWFAQLNNKMGGDLKKIKTVGEYLIEIWKAVGMDIDGDKVEFLWSSDEINSRAHEYWPLVMDIARRNKLPRIMRCVQIMGRSEQDELTAAQIFYPCMQCADIFFLKADICQLGMDQRKVNVLAREYCDDIKRKNKPIILSHHMLPGLQQGQEKMSKSDPSSSIFMEDEEVEVKTKIKKAYCPPQIVEGNPCLEYIKHIVFPWFNKFKVERNPENGGEKIYESFEELVSDYESGGLHPGDLKPALAKALNMILQPVRDHFSKDPKAKDLLKRVKNRRNFLLLSDHFPVVNHRWKSPRFSLEKSLPPFLFYLGFYDRKPQASLEEERKCQSLARGLHWHWSSVSVNPIALRLRIDHIKNVQERKALPYQVDMRARIRGNKGY